MTMMYERGTKGSGMSVDRRLRLGNLAQSGVLANVARADLFDFGDGGALVLFYAPAFSDQDRATIMATRSDGITLSCCDMRRADDVAFALYLRDELDCTRGIAPITISGQECARAGLSIAWGG